MAASVLGIVLKGFKMSIPVFKLFKKNGIAKFRVKNVIILILKGDKRNNAHVITLLVGYFPCQ